MIGRHDPAVKDSWTLAWGDEHRPVPVRDRAELDQLLTEASEEGTTSHTMVELVSPSGVSCAIGLGRPRSAVTFSALMVEPPFFLSRGDATSDESLVFFYNGHWTEFPPEAGIPVNDALDALRQFFESGQRPTAVKWDEV